MKIISLVLVAWMIAPVPLPAPAPRLDVVSRQLADATYAGDLAAMDAAIATLRAMASDPDEGWRALYIAGVASFQKALIVGPGGLGTAGGDPARVAAFTHDAIRDLEASIALKVDFAESHAMLSHCYLMPIGAPPDEQRTLITKAGERIAAARALAPRNPRVVLIDAMRVYYTPPQFGGDRAKGMALVQDAIGLFDRVKPGAAEPPLGQADALAWFAWLQLLADRPDIPQARAAVERALKLRPDFTFVKTRLLPRVSGGGQDPTPRRR
jgi:hypothetical protein